ncbi:MAG: response regulator [Myxococcales bacterium]|nr:response regulator [Myxococcales bacterium]
MAAVPGNRKVLVVDDEQDVRRVLAALLLDEGFEAHTAPGAEEALALIAQLEPAVVVSDLKMPDRDGLWLLEQVRDRFDDVEVILLTGYGQLETAVQALREGASDYLTKPVRLNQLSTAVGRALLRRQLLLENRAYQRGLEAMVQAKTKELAAAYERISETYNLTLEALVTALDARECETSNHSQRVVRTTLAIAQRMGVPEADMDDIARGALLHDIGKIGVPDGVLLKPGRLDEAEWEEMRKHPDIGARILSGIAFLEPAAAIVLAHQERWDGSGYPKGLAGEAIPLGARIFAVADALDAITSDRPYRRGRDLAYARAEIGRFGGTQFDPEVVEAFLSISDEEWDAIRAEAAPYTALP